MKSFGTAIRDSLEASVYTRLNDSMDNRNFIKNRKKYRTFREKGLFTYQVCKIADQQRSRKFVRNELHIER